MTKPTASLSLDLDNQWSYMKTHGDPGWEDFPSYLPILVPRVLELLRSQGLTITFFLVGQDAALDKNGEYIRMIAEDGHEIANHSFHHEPWLHRYTSHQLEEELDRSEDSILRATGQRPMGFRGPGFSLSEEVLRMLARRSYLYDASTFPTYLGPIARFYYFLSTRPQFQPHEREQRAALFGGLRDGFRRLRPYQWQLGDKRLLEIPVSTMPILKIPFHVSYILYLAGYSPSLASAYFRWALRMCRLTSTPVSLLLHPLDFLGRDDVQELAFFPAMNQAAGPKLTMVSRLLRLLTDGFETVTMRRHAELLLQQSLTCVAPSFSQ